MIFGAQFAKKKFQGPSLPGPDLPGPNLPGPKMPGPICLKKCLGPDLPRILWIVRQFACLSVLKKFSPSFFSSPFAFFGQSCQLHHPHHPLKGVTKTHVIHLTIAQYVSCHVLQKSIRVFWMLWYKSIWTPTIYCLILKMALGQGVHVLITYFHLYSPPPLFGDQRQMYKFCIIPIYEISQPLKKMLSVISTTLPSSHRWNRRLSLLQYPKNHSSALKLQLVMWLASRDMD